jgi:hypothetical protein
MRIKQKAAKNQPVSLDKKETSSGRQPARPRKRRRSQRHSGTKRDGK